MLTIRLDSPMPIGDQILAGIRRLIATGELHPGSELPPVRQLAADLGVNLNTVARAYRVLESDGLVTSIRGRGTQVLADREAPPLSERKVKQHITDVMRNTMADARLAGLDREAMEAIAQQVMAEFWSLSESSKAAEVTTHNAKEGRP